ncbi:hypothetical protein BC829DRAFT_35428 [Chytridium lagenaria]|nr:hypothetical protein BC829DRAFT_35428 [Chytridium lagenaria]
MSDPSDFISHMNVKVTGNVKGVDLVWEFSLQSERQEAPNIICSQIIFPLMSSALHCRTVIDKLIKTLDTKEKDISMQSGSSKTRKAFNGKEFINDHRTITDRHEEPSLLSTFFADPFLSYLHATASRAQNDEQLEYLDADFSQLHSVSGSSQIHSDSQDLPTQNTIGQIPPTQSPKGKASQSQGPQASLMEVLAAENALKKPASKPKKRKII